MEWRLCQRPPRKCGTNGEPRNGIPCTPPPTLENRTSREYLARIRRSSSAESSKRRCMILPMTSPTSPSNSTSWSPPLQATVLIQSSRATNTPLTISEALSGEEVLVSTVFSPVEQLTTISHESTSYDSATAE